LTAVSEDIVATLIQESGTGKDIKNPSQPTGRQADISLRRKGQKKKKKKKKEKEKEK
jgi:hypothetical protein